MRTVAATLQLRKVLAAAFAAFLVASCDGGGEGVTFEWTDPVPVDRSPAGIYNGLFQSTATARIETRLASGIVSQDSEIHLMMQPTSRLSQYGGVVSVDGETLTGTLTEYLGARGRWFGFDGVRSIRLDGIVSEQESLSGTYDGDDEGIFSLDYSPVYERTSSLLQTLGVWTFDLASSGAGFYSLTLDIGPQGELFGADSNGCIFTGEIVTIETRFNAYSVSVNVSSCDAVEGEYTGLAFRDESAEGSDRLHVFFANESYAFSSVFSR